MATIPWNIIDDEMLPLAKETNNEKARLFANVTKFLIDFTKIDENNPELYVGLNSCDSVCMFCVLDESNIEETKQVYACVEPFGQLASGHMISDWYGHFKRQPNVEIITNINKQKFIECFRRIIQ